MGRPLYSLSYTAPAIRTEPEAGVSPYEKWNHWNAFDPDSDEFFDNEHAVYEAFIDPNQAAQAAQEDTDQVLVVDLVQRREGSNSSSSSEGTVSEQGSPMAVGSDDPARMLAEAYPTVDWELHSESTNADGRPSHESTSRYVANMFDMASRAETEVGGIARRHSRSASITMLPEPPTPLSRSPRSMITSNAVETLPRTSDITPINIPVNRNRAASTRGSVEQVANSPSSSPLFSSTPPSLSSIGQSSSSPGNSATPTFLTWRRHPMTPVSPTPNSNGPLTNPNARMSLTHIAPTLIRVQNVI